MAKFRRFDPRNKKAGSHKKRTKYGENFKRIKTVDVKKGKQDYESETIRAQGD